MKHATVSLDARGLKKQGHRIKSWMSRLGGGLVLAGALVATAPRPMLAQSVDVRIYDSHHHDYHNWDDREDRAYRRYLAEKRYEYREYQRQSHRRQEAYWAWRHKHPE